MAGTIEGNITDWGTHDVSKAETELVQINDPGAGTEVVLRHFFFKSQPVPKGYPLPSKLELISQFKRLIEMSLWSDGLIIREDRQLELHTRAATKKFSKSLYLKMIEEHADFVILCLAEPRRGQVVHDKAHIVGKPTL